MENYIAKLEEEKAALEKEVKLRPLHWLDDLMSWADLMFYLTQVSDLKITCQMVEKRAQEQKQAEEKKHGEEINFLKRTNQQLKSQLEGIISQKK